VQRKQVDLEERDNRRRRKDEELMAKHVELPQLHYEKTLSEDDKQVIRKEEMKRKAKEKVEAIQKSRLKRKSRRLRGRTGKAEEMDPK
jgi:hypothetical protein